MHGSSRMLVEEVAARLGPELREEVALLGGATIELLLTDPAVAEVRATNDADVIAAARLRVLQPLVSRGTSQRATTRSAQRNVDPTAPYVLARKIEAFHGRGEGDYLMSHDVGDIIALVDGRQEIASRFSLCQATYPTTQSEPPSCLSA